MIVFRILTVMLSLAALFWLAGLVSFVDDVDSFRERHIDETMEETDAIVVLTGGSERLQAGIELLRHSKGKMLLISGVHKGIGKETLLASYGDELPETLVECCVHLGHAAADTVGNAAETAEWMKHWELKSLRLVTAHYHMPRSLMLFREAMPKAKIIAHPVFPNAVMLGGWWLRPGTALLLMSEYNKYLLARFT